MGIWRQILGAVRDGYSYGPHAQSVEEGDIDADRYGFVPEEGEVQSGADLMYNTGQNRNTKQGLWKKEREIRQIRWNGRKWGNAFRDGRHVGRSLTLHPFMEECEGVRRATQLGMYGSPPFVKWDPMKDTANTLYEKEVAGNISLPKKKIGEDRWGSCGPGCNYCFWAE